MRDSAWRRCVAGRGQPNGYDEALAVLNGLHRKPGDPRCLIDFQLLTAAMGAAGAHAEANGNGLKSRLNGHAKPQQFDRGVECEKQHHPCADGDSRPPFHNHLRNLVE